MSALSSPTAPHSASSSLSSAPTLTRPSQHSRPVSAIYLGKDASPSTPASGSGSIPSPAVSSLPSPPATASSQSQDSVGRARGGSGRRADDALDYSPLARDVGRRGREVFGGVGRDRERDAGPRTPVERRFGGEDKKQTSPSSDRIAALAEKNKEILNRVNSVSPSPHSASRPSTSASASRSTTSFSAHSHTRHASSPFSPSPLPPGSTITSSHHRATSSYDSAEPSSRTGTSRSHFFSPPSAHSSSTLSSRSRAPLYDAQHDRERVTRSPERVVLLDSPTRALRTASEYAASSTRATRGIPRKNSPGGIGASASMSRTDSGSSPRRRSAIPREFFDSPGSATPTEEPPSHSPRTASPPMLSGRGTGPPLNSPLSTSRPRPQAHHRRRESRASTSTAYDNDHDEPDDEPGGGVAPDATPRPSNERRRSDNHNHNHRSASRASSRADSRARLRRDGLPVSPSLRDFPTSSPSVASFARSGQHRTRASVDASSVASGYSDRDRDRDRDRPRRFPKTSATSLTELTEGGPAPLPPGDVRRTTRHSTSSNMGDPRPVPRTPLTRSLRQAVNAATSIPRERERPATSLAFVDAPMSAPPVGRERRLQSRSVLGDYARPPSRTAGGAVDMLRGDTVRPNTPQAQAAHLATLESALSSAHGALARHAAPSAAAFDRLLGGVGASQTRVADVLRRAAGLTMETLVSAEIAGAPPDEVDALRAINSLVRDAARTHDEGIRDLTEALTGLPRLLREAAATAAAAESPSHMRSASLSLGRSASRNMLVSASAAAAISSSDKRRAESIVSSQSRRSAEYASPTASLISPSTSAFRPRASLEERAAAPPARANTISVASALSPKKLFTIRSERQQQREAALPASTSPTRGDLPIPLAQTRKSRAKSSSQSNATSTTITPASFFPSLGRAAGATATTAVTHANAERGIVERGDVASASPTRRTRKTSLGSLMPWRRGDGGDSPERERR